MERIDSSLENDIVERSVEDRSSAIRRRRRESSNIAIDVLDAPKVEIHTPLNTETKSSEFINNYNPVDIAKLATEIVSEQMGIKTEAKAKVEVKTETKKAPTQDLNKDFIKVTQIKEDWAETTMAVNMHEEETEINDIVASKREVGSIIRINMRGKLAIGVASVAMVMLLFLTFYNVAMISSLNSNIAQVNALIQLEEDKLVIREDAYNLLVSDLEAIARSLGLKPIDNGNTIYYSPADMTTVNETTAETNWFTEFVKWVQNLFSGS